MSFNFGHSKSANSSKFFTIYNTETGQKVLIDRNMSRYLRMSQGFMNLLRLKARFVKHISINQAVESYKPGILNNFLMALKRRYGNIHYIWSVEIQEKRLLKYGDAVLHWHILCAFDYEVGLDFGATDIRKIASYWKYGICEIVPVTKPSVGYLMKYITKALNADIGDHKIRRMGCSRIDSCFRQSWRKLAPAIDVLTARGFGVDQWRDALYWDYKGGYVILDHEVRLRRGRLCRFKNKYYVYQHPKTDWAILGMGDLTTPETEQEALASGAPF